MNLYIKEDDRKLVLLGNKLKRITPANMKERGYTHLLYLTGSWDNFKSIPGYEFIPLKEPTDQIEWLNSTPLFVACTKPKPKDLVDPKDESTTNMLSSIVALANRMDTLIKDSNQSYRRIDSRLSKLEE